MNALITALVIAALSLDAQETASEVVTILQSNCSSCHGAAVSMSGLDASSREGLLKGGTRGPAIQPGNPESSLLIQAVKRQGKVAMPPAKALTPGEVGILERWVQAGAPWEIRTGHSSPATSWWSFQQVVRPTILETGSPWGKNAIDAFIHKKLQEAQLGPSAEASRRSQIRRLFFGLTGLPPTAAEVEAFEKDTRPEAYSELVERLLASPAYGEKWARHWLDLVRYSDTMGFELDSHIADAFRYRDWVIASFNSDKPYDRFVREQLAGDEFWPEDPAAVTGTGYFCVGPSRDTSPDQTDINREETMTDYVDTTASVFLGATFACARCHDHKFDPFTQKDYYRFRAIFAPMVKKRIPLDRLEAERYEAQENEREVQLWEVADRIRAVEARCRAAGAKPADIDACLTPEESTQRTALGERLLKMFSSFQPKPFACGVGDIGDHSPRTLMPVRGSKTGEPVQPGIPSIFGGAPIHDRIGPREATGPIPLNPTTERRRALADWVASPGNPLTARVIVNRIWQYHFGRGITATPSDFGSRGQAPSHRLLLDWLAAEFVQSGWSIKHIHRLILNSATYRQATDPSPEALAKDPENALLSHFSRRRLDSDEIRDSILLTTDSLNRKTGGRPVVPRLSPEEFRGVMQRADTLWVVTDDDREYDRRSIYMFQKRTFRPALMEVFDTPESMVTCARRDESTTSPQSLTLWNGAFAVNKATELARKLASQAAGSDARIQNAWRQILSRNPSAQETASAKNFLADQAVNMGSSEGALRELVRALLNSNEFLYID